CHIHNGDSGIHMLTINDGRSSGECFVALESEYDVKTALSKSREHIGKRYIEVFRAKDSEYNFYVKNNGLVSWREPVIRMSGLPYRCSISDIQKFFDGLEISKNGVYIVRDFDERAIGDGYVAFANMDNAYEAMELNQKQIGHRYIELYPSTYKEVRQRIASDASKQSDRFSGLNDTKGRGGQSKRHHSSRSRSRSPTDRRSPVSTRLPAHSCSRSRSRDRRSSSVSNKYTVKMRGLPYRATEENIRKFFSPSCEPSSVEILYHRQSNLPNGDAFAHFDTYEDAKRALKFDKKYMGSRYIELYFESSGTNERPSRERHRSHSHDQRNSRNERNNYDVNASNSGGHQVMNGDSSQQGIGGGASSQQISTTVSTGRVQNNNGLKAKRFQRNNLNRFDPTGQQQYGQQRANVGGGGGAGGAGGGAGGAGGAGGWPQQGGYDPYTQQQGYGMQASMGYGGYPTDPYYNQQQAYNQAAAMYGQPTYTDPAVAMYSQQQPQPLVPNSMGGAIPPESPKGGHVVYVYGIGQRATQTELQMLFEQFGRVLRVDVIIDFNTSLCKGYAFVAMERYQDAQAAIQNLNRMPFHGRQLQVRFKTTT
ncbi:unnamed protein product, partial [Didymodactylos carnosus]